MVIECFYFFFKSFNIIISDEVINENLIGEVNFEFEKKVLNKINVSDILLNGKQKIFDLNVQPVEILALPNHQILSANYYDKSLTLYDENFKLIKKIDKINGENFEPRGIQLDDRENKLFISDRTKNQIIVTDLQFNKINIGNEELRDVCSIYYKNGNLYACDRYNKKVQIYSKDLEFQKYLPLHFIPLMIKGSDTMLAIEGHPSGLYFYSINDLTFHHQFNNGYCRLSSDINNQFYEFQFNTNKLFCYDQNGTFKEELCLSNKNKSSILSDGDGYLLSNGVDCVFMTCFSKKKIIKFSKNL